MHMETILPPVVGRCRLTTRRAYSAMGCGTFWTLAGKSTDQALDGGPVDG